MRRFGLLGLVLSAALLPGACGGGGGGDTGGVPLIETGTTMMSADELRLAMEAFAAMNAHRASLNMPLPDLVWYAPGAQVDWQHSVDMDATGMFAHVINGKGAAARAGDAGITHDVAGYVGENLGNGVRQYFSGGEMVAAWIASPEHYAQIVAPRSVPGAAAQPEWTHCSVGVHARGEEIWWTATFFRNPMP